jgi:alpha-L-fucosidase 2
VSGQDYDGGNTPGGAEHIKQDPANCCATGKTAEAEELVKQHLGVELRAFGAYQNFGDLLIESPGHPAEVSQVSAYVRKLEIGHGAASVQYERDGETFVRTYFASFPDQVIVVHYGSSRPGSISVNIRLKPAHENTSVSASGGRLTLSGKLEGNKLGFEAIAEVRAEGGRISNNTDGSIEVAAADSVTVLLTAATEYALKYPK